MYGRVVSVHADACSQAAQARGVSLLRWVSSRAGKRCAWG